MSGSGNSGIGCTAMMACLLTVLFVGLKLTGHIEWSWWWVLAPVWIYAVIVFLVLCVILVVIVAMCGGFAAGWAGIKKALSRG